MINILKRIYRHPLNEGRRINAIFKFIKWQVSSRLWGGPFVYDWIDGSRLIISNGMVGATGNIYVGLMEYEDMSFLLHYLKEDNLFFDIGANVGVYTVLASQVKKANSVAIEPISLTYERLIDNIQINRLSNVVSMNIGLSFEKSKLYFTTGKDAMNSVALPSDKDTLEVEVDTLDNLSSIYGYPKIIKMDVEGYETNVLRGASKTLESDNLEVIIIELNGSGNKFGYSDEDIHTNLQLMGFDSFTYDPFNREIIKLETYGEHNTIYIRKSIVNKIKKQIKLSKKFHINGMDI
jgi:FkbM family methyltransferase